MIFTARLEQTPNAKCDPSCDVSRAKASKATDLEPIPVEDTEQERKNLPHGFKSTPDSIFCRVCGKAGTNPLHYKPIKTFPGKRDAGYANDSSHRARLHRALDAVLDRKAAKDAAGDYEVVWTDRAYKDHHKIFKNDPQGAPNNGEAKARKYAKQLESADSKDKYGNIRGLVSVRAVN